MIYKDSSKPIETRVQDLLSRMTLDEKIAQTLSINPVMLAVAPEKQAELLENGKITDENLVELMKNGMGSLQLPGKNMAPKESGMYRNILQKHLMENTRLQIPFLSQEECLNGQLAKGATMFPRPIGMAGSFDRELVQEVYSAVGNEARARGAHQAFTPVLDIGRDPRWGRIEETFGEDTYLVAQMGLSVVKGLQGGANGVKDGHIISSPKHMVGYAQGAGGRNFAPTTVSKRELHDQILPPFKTAVKEGGALGIMPSHADIDGVPCHGNHWLLTELLKEEWGFKGIVVSDYNDIERLDILHHVAQDTTQAAAMGLKAGMDMDVPAGSAFRHLAKAIECDASLIEHLDNAVARILRLKFALGLFENPYVDIDKIEDVVNCEKHIELAKKAARKVPILLKNENKTLPLQKGKTANIAVIGPTAHPVEFSYYSERPNIGVSILDGIKEKAGENCNVAYEMGCHITKNSSAMETELDAEIENPTLYSFEEEKESIEKAVEIAKNSDVAIVCLGGSPSTSREAVTLMAHYGDNAHLDLVGQQNELLRRVLQTGTPTVVVLINGKPLSCEYVYNNAHAVLECWYLGTQTGTGVADILFGDVNPSGKLPVTIARSAGHLPSYYSQKATAFLKDYLFEKEGPLFWFGYGLSYTEYDYSNLRLSSPQIKKGESITVSVDVKNTGERDGEEIVQLYVSDIQASVVRPSIELKGFEKVFIKAGETKTVVFEIKTDMFEFTGLDYKPTIESGEFKISVGKNCKDVLTAELELV